MYLEHFGLDQLPFALTADTEFFLDYGVHKDTLGALHNTVISGDGLTKVTGEAGTGKTLLCRMLLSALDDSYVTAHISNPSVTPRALHMALAKELEIKHYDKMGQPRLLEIINERLIALHAEGKQVVLLIDEAQSLPDDSLEALRLLSNLETEKNKLLQLVLFGQPELDTRLHQDHLGQLYQRIVVSYTLEPLANEALSIYMQHRLHVAGYRGVPLFSPKALTLLYRGSGGIPRRINVLAHNAMLLACVRNDSLINTFHIRTVMTGTENLKSRRQRLRKSLVPVSTAGVFVAVVLAGFVPNETARDQLAQSLNHACLETVITSTSELPVAREEISTLLPAIHDNNLETNYSTSVQITDHRPSEYPQILSEFNEAAFTLNDGSLTETQRQLEELLSQDTDQRRTPNQSYLETAVSSLSPMPLISVNVDKANKPPEPSNSLLQNSSSQRQIVKSKAISSPRRVAISAVASSKTGVAKNTVNKPKINTAKSKVTKSKTGIAKNKIATAQPTVSTENMESDRTASIVVTHRPLTEKQQHLYDFNVAARAYNEGNFTVAERLLEDLLAQDKGLHQARLLLARLYARQQLNRHAESILSHGLLQYPEHVAYANLYAQMLAAQGRDGEAINTLQKALPSARDNAQFHALLAGLHQRTGNSEAAIASYRIALRLEPQNGEWWMGLGISNDQSGDWSTATNAYRRALQYPLTGAVEQYAEQRIQQLAAKNTTSKKQNNK